MNSQSAWQTTLSFFPDLPVVVEPIDAHLTSDAGLLLFREFDEQRGLTAAFAAALSDPRRAASIDHPYLQMVRARVYGILADYEDQNDHDTLRTDAAFKLIAGRSPDGPDLASQPTLSRFENSVDIASLNRLREVQIDQFIAGFHEAPSSLTFDIDCFDDPAHGQQQLVFFHGFYEQYQYLPRVITCAENDETVLVQLLYGTASPELGADDDLRHLVQRLREVRPDVKIHVRGDSGFGKPVMYRVCEELRVEYSFGLGMNPVLKRNSEDLLNQAVSEYEKQGQPQRLFTGFSYAAQSWDQERYVVVKAEANAQGTNRRAVVTNRPGAPHFPQGAYDEYADRGESENRNKELKRGLCGDRLSDHRFMANFFRLYMHALALNILVGMRRLVAAPPPEPRVAEIPLEAATPYAKRSYANRRRKEDPLGEGHACTWRTRLIKVAAQIVVTTRRVWIRLSGSWPHLEHFRKVAETIVATFSRGTG